MANEARAIKTCQRISALAPSVKTLLIELEVYYQDKARGNFDTGAVTDQAALATALGVDSLKYFNNFLDEMHNIYTGGFGDRLSELT
jgi:hypothetical protein